MKERRMISRDEKLGGGPSVTITSRRVEKHVEITYLWYQQVLKALNRAIEIEQVKQKIVLKVLNETQEIEQVKQNKIISCI